MCAHSDDASAAISTKGKNNGMFVYYIKVALYYLEALGAISMCNLLYKNIKRKNTGVGLGLGLDI